MKTVVTGGAGFIGSHLVDRLLKDKHEVMVIDDLSRGTIKNVDERATLVHYDLSKGLPYYVKKHMESVDIVFHLAAFSRVEPSIQNPKTDWPSARQTSPVAVHRVVHEIYQQI